MNWKFWKKKEEIKEHNGFLLYDIVKTCNGIGVIIRFQESLDRAEQPYIGALIRYTKPYVSNSFQSTDWITKDIENE